MPLIPLNTSFCDTLGILASVRCAGSSSQMHSMFFQFLSRLGKCQTTIARHRTLCRAKTASCIAPDFYLAFARSDYIKLAQIQRIGKRNIVDYTNSSAWVLTFFFRSIVSYVRYEYCLLRLVNAERLRERRKFVRAKRFLLQRLLSYLFMHPLAGRSTKMERCLKAAEQPITHI